MRSTLEDTLQIIAITRRIADENGLIEAFRTLALAADLLGREQISEVQRRATPGSSTTQCAVGQPFSESCAAI